MPHPDVFQYLDHRRFLADWFEARKKANPRFSHRLFARRAGLGSPGTLLNVVRGRRNLAPATARRVARALSLGAEATSFFLLLVQFGQAEDEHERAEAWALVSATRRFRQARRIEGDGFEYLSHWYYPAIRELAARPDFKADAGWIARALRPAIEPDQAREALKALLSLGLLVERGGRLERAEASVATAPEVAGLAAHNYHRGMLQRAAEAMAAFGPSERYLGGLTVAVPASLVGQLKEEVMAFQSRMLDLCDSAPGAPDRVYQLGVQLFTMSEALGTRPAQRTRGGG